MDNSTATTAEAALTDLYTGILFEGTAADFLSLEGEVLGAGHALMARALGSALERLDAALCSEIPSGWHVHDVRERTLATTFGDVAFKWHRLRGADGALVPLAEELDLALGREGIARRRGLSGRGRG